MNASSCLIAISLGCLVLVPAKAAEISRSHRDASGQVWSLHLGTDEKVRFSHSAPSAGKSRTVSLQFRRDEAAAAEALLRKSLQWAAVAEKNAVTALERELGLLGETALSFRVESDEDRVRYGIHVPGEEQALTMESAREFLKLLAHLPAIDAEMARNKESGALLPESEEEVARNAALGLRAKLHARALASVRERLAGAGPAQYSTLGPADDGFTSCRPLENGLWEARGVVQAKFDGMIARRTWAVRLRPRANNQVEIMSTEIKLLSAAPRLAR
jgi:hypothetical protein